MSSHSLDLPDSPAVRGALEVARRYHSEAMLNHCIRSSLFAAELGRSAGLDVDGELLVVSALLHDIGLEAAFDSHTLPFEVAGGEVAWVFGAGAGWPEARRTRAGEIIVRHMWDDVDPAVDPEGYLLCEATGLDISGRGAERWNAGFLTEVLDAYPRGGLRTEFVACFAAQARRKPDSSAASAIAGGIAARLATNPLEYPGDGGGLSGGSRTSS